jgi:hypothetical protein
MCVLRDAPCACVRRREFSPGCVRWSGCVFVRAQLEFDHSHLAFEYHAAIVAAMGFVQPALSVAKRDKTLIQVRSLGGGGGGGGGGGLCG